MPVASDSWPVRISIDFVFLNLSLHFCRIFSMYNPSTWYYGCLETRPRCRSHFNSKQGQRRDDSLGCNILQVPSDKFSKFSLTHIFPKDSHCSIHARTLERHRTNFPPDYATVIQGFVPNSSSPTTTTVSREDLVRLLSARLAMTVNEHLLQNSYTPPVGD